MFDEVFSRIKLALNTRTQVQLAEVLDIRQSSISDAKRRDSVPAEWYLKLFKKYGLNPDWLEEGVGPWYLKNQHGEYVPVEGPSDVAIAERSADYSGQDNKGVMVTVYQMRCEETEEGFRPLPGGKLSVPKSYARPGVQVVKMSASSMEPLVRRGAYVGIDTEQKDVISGELYGVYIPNEGLSLKRVFLDAESDRYVLRSEKAGHPEQYLPVDQRQSRVFGRAVWVLQEV